MARANDWKLGPRPYHADDQCVGQTLRGTLSRVQGRVDGRQMQEQFDWILNTRRTAASLCPKQNPDRFDRWPWCDSLFMAPPA